MSRIYPDDWYCSGVYMITNKATGERYVGASKTVCDRIQQHFTREPTLYPWKKFYQDILKFGRDGFTVCVLQKQDRYDKDELLKLEQFWYDKIQPEYNLIRPQENHLIDPLTKKLAKSSERWVAASEKRKSLYRTEKYRKVFSDVQNKRKKKCRMFNREISMEFESFMDCARWLDENTKFTAKNKASKIKAVCDGDRANAFGYKFEYL